MESLRDLSDEIENALDKTARDVSRFASGPLRFNFIPSNRTTTEQTVSKVRAIKLQCQILAKRQGKERCLRCGSLEARPVDELNSLRGKFNKSDQAATGFKHPNCGGEFVLVPNPFWVNVAFEPKCYDFEGHYIDQKLPVPDYGWW